LLWAALLAGIAGYVDAICFLRLGGAFAANMTGNLVEVGLSAAQGHWGNAAWCVSLLVAFFLGVLVARLILRTHQSPRLSLLIEAAIIIVAAGDLLGIAAVPALAVAMAMQNEAVTHGIVAVNVGFVTGEIQRLGERLVAETVPGQRETQAPIVLTILVCYAAGAAIGALASRWDAAALILPAAVLAGIALLPRHWIGSGAQQP
jgi:uncharacterized membrane protein YoaK (UPF0700 family)